MFGWTTEKNLKGNIRKNIKQDYRLSEFLEELRKYGIDDISYCGISSKNCFTINGNGYMLLFQRNLLWQPYFSTIEGMNDKFQKKWTLVCVSYKNNEPDIYIISSDRLNDPENNIRRRTEINRKYYEIKPADGMEHLGNMNEFAELVKRGISSLRNEV